MAKRIDISGRIINDEYARMYSYWGFKMTNPEMIKNALIEASGADVELYINSPGGSVIAASEIYTELKEYKGNITAKIVGMAASAASWIAMAADKVLMSPTGLMMVHNSSTYSEGDHREMESSRELLSQIDEAIRNAYKSKTGLTDEKLKEMMNVTTWFNCHKAKKYNMVDEIMFDSADNLSPEDIINGLTMPEGVLVNILNQRGGVEVNKNENVVIANETDSTEDKTGVNEIAENVNEITADGLKNSHRAIYDEIFNAGVNSERSRIENIEDMGVLGFEELVNAAKFKEPINAEMLAMNIIKAQKTKNDGILQDLKNDKKDIVVDNTSSESVKSDDIASQIAKAANERRK